MLETRVLDVLTVGKSFVEYEDWSEVGRLIEAVVVGRVTCSNFVESLNVTPIEWRCGFLLDWSRGCSIGGLPRIGRYMFKSVCGML